VSKLKELEKRLREEPDNLGLRVMVAGAMREAGRQNEAVELYRSVAIAYRDQGRTQQAIAVCRSILEIAPYDDRCHALLNALAPPPVEPVRRSSMEETPLPRALPYHVADPTTQSLKKLSEISIATDVSTIAPLDGEPTRPGSEDTPPAAAVAGIANAARRISASLVQEDLAAELDTRQRPRIESADLERISQPPPTVPFERIEVDSSEEEHTEERTEEPTEPRDMLGLARAKVPLRSALASPFFAPLPVDRRAQVAAMFERKAVPSGTTVIRQGESNHPLILVARGRLDLRAERTDGQLVQVGTIGIGEYVGEAALLQRTPAIAHVVAATDADLMLLAAKDLLELARVYPALWAELKDVGERRRREHDQRMRTR